MVIAGAGWGAVFVAPELAPLAPALLLAMGRFVAFGVVSLPQVRAVLRADVPWARVVAHALTGSLVYYGLVALAVRLAGPTIAVATIGLVPVVMALISARRRGRAGLLALAPALGLVAVGQALVHSAPTPGPGGWSAVVGTLLALAAVASWSWYGVDSHRLLAARPDLGPVLAGAQGLAAGVLALPLGIWLLAVGGVPAEPVRALLVVLFLGLVSSWLAVRLWHAAAGRLSPVLVSQLMALETAWGFVFAASLAGAVPGPFALVGEVALVAGVALAVVTDGHRERREQRAHGVQGVHGDPGSSASTARATRSAASRTRDERGSSAEVCATASSSAHTSNPA
ncbi:threonine/homoserine efflux transporter RhtA [Actinomycetospora cinnamomea]|uniref:Threonine/homoserine efflux transporter RhtA n=2 Tax=Actinomycetospora cinnamomea TaxID=663609 RepID=A0A2U1FL47_9PSEU|nr:threonine/homoserine efflux transporter RhtA [Actinomycetospora cinnamomea]